MAHTRCRTLFALLAVIGITAPLLPARIAVAAETRTFYATAVGDEAVPPVATAAHAALTAGLNDDGSLTYTVTSTGFSSGFRAAVLQAGPRGAAGPTIAALECNSSGTVCGGTSQPLADDARAALSAGGLYVSLETDAFPDGEIRGQVVSVALQPPTEEASTTRFSGLVIVGKTNDAAALKIAGRFQLEAPVDLRTSTAVIGDLLEQIDATGVGDSLPIPLALVHANARGTAAVYHAAATGTDPGCRLSLKGHGHGAYDFRLACKRGSGAPIRFPSGACGKGAHSTGKLRTGFVVNGGDTFRVRLTQAWRCLGAHAVRTNATDGSSDTSSTNHAPRADFRAAPKSGRAPLVVAFTNKSSDADGDSFSSLWDFGDGSQSSASDPTHTYKRAGTFHVTLSVTDSHGAVSSPKRDTVNVALPLTTTTTTTPSSTTSTTLENRPPVADFRTAPKSGPAPLTVTFTNKSTDPDGDSFKSSWDFGDGSTSSALNPTHVFTEPGTFTIVLIVTDARGGVSKPKTDIVNVGPPITTTTTTTLKVSTTTTTLENRPPIADFRTAPKSGPAPLTVTFTNKSTDPDGDSFKSSWDFGDGSTSSALNPTHVFTEPGTFTIVLIVTDARGAVSKPHMDIVNVGPPITTTTTTPSSTTSTTLENRTPIADFRMNLRSGMAPLTVAFTNKSSDPDGDTFTSLWDFGDGSQSTAVNPTHTYSSSGDFRITLVVTDSHGAMSNPKRDMVSVKPPSPTPEMPIEENRAPVADFRMSTRSGPAPLTVTFTNKTTDADGDAFTSHWDFGDGSESSEANPTHTYTSAGTFHITFIATDARGLSSSPKRDSVTAE